MKDLVSVVVTCYNHEKYIEQCLESIFSQTYKTIELIVINDGSKDQSDKLIKEVLVNAPFNRTEYIYQENQGVCVTRNLGLELINGEFLLFVDSDNFLDNDYIEKLIDSAETKSADIVYTDLFDVEKNEIFMKAKEFDLESYLTENFIDNGSLIRTSKIKASRYDLNLNRKKLVDYDFIMNLILVNHAIPVKCSTTKLNYRVLENSISRGSEHNSEKYYYEVYLYILGKYSERLGKPIFEAAKNNVMILENRLSELINHLDIVTGQIKNQEKDILSMLDERQQLDKRFMDANHHIEKLTVEYEMQVQHANNLDAIISQLENEKMQLLNSTSFRLGNRIIQPFYYLKRVVRNPKLVLKAGKKIKSVIVMKAKRIPKPQTLGLKLVRSVQRKKNNYENPNRCLVYVIYENQERIQKYKIIFLEALAKLSDEVLIVVNGSLHQEDQNLLESIGKVQVRENSGYDTGAFRFGIQYLGENKLSQYDELLLVNDTNIGPIKDLAPVFAKMAQKKLDFWGISYGEEQEDITSFNKYKYIPKHLQSYFLVIEKSLLTYKGFYTYWDELKSTNKREEAIGKHETVFTKHFSDLGFKHGAVTENNKDSAMYIHPLKMIEEGVPLIKYSALGNYSNDKFLWHGLVRETEVPKLLEYISEETDYPMPVMEEIMQTIKGRNHKEYILIIDGVENFIPQLTTYRVNNKVEQLKSLGFNVKKVNLSQFKLHDAEYASHIIIYRASYTSQLVELIQLARRNDKPVLYDIDDLVIDTKYTDQLTYVKGLSASDKNNYDIGVINYGKLLRLCDGAITTTKQLKAELENYVPFVLMNRNLASEELVHISKKTIKNYSVKNEKIRIGYFSGSISHNENFELIKPAIIKLMNEFQEIELYLVGHLDLPKDLQQFENRIITNDFVTWEELPKLISSVDINLAPLVTSIFNEAKSEIKWLEAALVKVPTVASNIGAFEEMIVDEQTGILVNDDEWYSKLKTLIQSDNQRETIAENAFQYVIENCTTEHKIDELVGYIDEETI